METGTVTVLNYRVGFSKTEEEEEERQILRIAEA